jgi:general secretion pathway protein G
VVNNGVPRSAGFTLLELITVVAIIGILVGIALPNYKTAIMQSREAVLKEDLFRFRDVIDQYYADKGKYPASLDSLVDEGYLRKVPADPITGAPDWEVAVREDQDNPSDTPVSTTSERSTATSQAGTPTANGDAQRGRRGRCWPWASPRLFLVAGDAVDRLRRRVPRGRRGP